MFRRRCFNFRVRSKTSFLLIIVCLSVAGIFICYQLLKELSSSSGPKSIYPTLERRKPKYQAYKRFGANNLDPEILVPIVQQRDLTSEVVEIRGNYDAVSIKDLVAFLNALTPQDWSTTEQPDELAIELKHLLLDLNLESQMSCKDIDNLKASGALAQSNRKFVDRGQSDDSHRMEYALVSQSVDLDTKVACMKKIYNDEHCTPMGNYKLFKQLLLLAVLKHPNIIELRGYCLRGDGISSEIRKKGAIIVTGIGSPIRVGGFTLLSWKKRLLFGLEMIELLDYLENNPLGSLGLGKLASHDFVLINGDDNLQLVDLDDIKMNERSCTSTSECDIGGVDYGIQCVSDRCQGINALYNLQKISIAVLDPLLRNGPSSTRNTIDDLLDQLRTLKVSKQKLKTALQKLLDEADKLTFQYGRNNNRRHDDRNGNHDNENYRNKNNVDSNEYNRDQNEINQNNLKKDNMPSDYVRMDQSNFPGMFDYICDNSRVGWGCVITCRSLREAKRRCNEDINCKAFVVFSTQPELDTLMTVVLKSSGASSAQPNPGTTLFIRRRYHGLVQSDNNIVKMSQENNNIEPLNNGVIRNVVDINRATATSSPTSVKHSITVCLRKIFKGHEEPRKSREKRLMAHFGLKGLRESEWQRSVDRQKAGSFSNLIVAKDKGGVSRGGKFLVLLKADDVNEIVSKAVFTAEEGENQYHIAQAIVYHLDRLLGLYHTPPSIVGKIPALTVQKYQKNGSWKMAFAMVLKRDGSLKGIYSAPIPHVMKQDHISIKPLKSMVSNIVKFSRQAKLQFEYVFLWWLTKITKDQTDHIGYKGHLIHFNGDEAFSSGSSQDLTGYFNHCQFPNIVYKTLNCLRCHNNQGTQLTSICYLGQEVIKRVKSNKFTSEDIELHGYDEDDIIVKVNDAASTAMRIVDVCIKTFGREQVLY